MHTSHDEGKALRERAPSPHPEQSDPLGRRSHAHGRHDRTPQERRAIRTLAIGLVATAVLIPIIAAISVAPTLNVLIGLAPLLVALILGIAAVGQHYRHIVLLYLLVFTHVLGLAFVWLCNLGLAVPVNVSNAVLFSFLLGAIVVACTLLAPGDGLPKQRPEPKHPIEFHEEKLGDYIHAIEDKVKGLNFAIGRVYRRSNGASDAMRERLRISREWYNEFYEIKPEDLDAKKSKAKVLVHKINDRLKLLASKEREVFSEAEIKALKNLARNKSGGDAVIDVLKTNDRDPVEHYYVSALDVCETLLQGLQ